MHTSFSPCMDVGQPTGTPLMSSTLQTGYGELARAEENLSRAEQELLAAHMQFRGRTEPRPELVFQKVLALRALCRQLIEQLGEELVAG